MQGIDHKFTVAQFNNQIEGLLQANIQLYFYLYYETFGQDLMGIL